MVRTAAALSATGARRRTGSRHHRPQPVNLTCRLRAPAPGRRAQAASWTFPRIELADSVTRLRRQEHRDDLSDASAADHRGRQLSAARLAGEPRGAGERTVCRTYAQDIWRIPEHGSSRRKTMAPSWRFATGAGRHRHYHRRRNPPRELFQPLRARIGRHRCRASGRAALATAPRHTGAARDWKSATAWSGGTARCAIPATADRSRDEDHAARSVHPVTTRPGTSSMRTRKRWRWTMPPPSTPSCAT